MTITYYPDLEQGSEEWLQARCGIVTASAIGSLITREQPSPIEYDCPDCESPADAPCISKARKVATPLKTFHGARSDRAASAPGRLVVSDSDTARGLIFTLAAERITGHVDPTYLTADMLRGHDEEPYARDAYAKHYGPVTEMGFITEDKWGVTIGVSPDGLVNDEGGIEIKSRRAKTHVEIVISGEVPDRHMAQIQTALLVTGRAWWDYVDFSNGMHLFPKRVYPEADWRLAIVAAAQRCERRIADIIERYHAAVIGLPMTERIPDYGEIEVA